MIRSAPIRKIIIGVVPSLAVAMFAAGGATAAQASAQSVHHRATAGAAAVPRSNIAD